jgi:hypothetical protein
MVAVDPDYRCQVRSAYNDSAEIWDMTDRWHAWAKGQIEIEMSAVSNELKARCYPASLVVDVGSAGNPYGLGDVQRIDIDLAEKRLAGCTRPICANIESLPLRSRVSDLTVCVGSVLNYASLEESILELHRITKVGGAAIFQLELSNASEFIGHSAYAADAAFVTTFYRGEEKLWVYSDSYIKRVLIGAGFSLVRVRYYHILSSMILRLTRRPNFATAFAPLDHLWSYSRAAGSWADSGIYVCSRNG